MDEPKKEDRAIVQETVDLIDRSSFDPQCYIAADPDKTGFIGSTTRANMSRDDAKANSNLCILCQRRIKQIIFEPCRHLLICGKCSVWACRKFCPRCYRPIKDKKSIPFDYPRTSPFAISKNSPEVQSAYSFMEF